MERAFLPLNHQGGVVSPTLEGGKVCVTIRGNKHLYSVANTSILKNVGADYRLDITKHCLLYTPTYVCVVDIDDKNQPSIVRYYRDVANNMAMVAWYELLTVEKKRFVEKGYYELLIPLPRKIGQTNKCYLVEGPNGQPTAMAKKEYNALCRANTTIKAHFERIKQLYNNRPITREQKIAYIKKNNILESNEGLETASMDDIDRCISAWDKAEALGAG